MHIFKQVYKFVVLFPKRPALLIFISMSGLIALGTINTKEMQTNEDILSKRIGASAFIQNEEPQAKPQELSFRVKRNDSLISILKKSGANQNSIQAIIKSKNSQLLTRLRIGEIIKTTLNLEGNILTLDYQQLPTKGISVFFENEKYFIKPYTKVTESVSMYKEVTIEESLYTDGLKAKIPDSVIMDMAYIYGWDIDFTYDLRPGDSFSLIYEEILLDGEKIKDGDILIAKFNLQGKELIATRFDQKNGKSEYFSPEGQNMKKAFLRSPVNFSYVSDRYNLKRKHPILFKIKAHTGVDYAAARGTPVIATGDGTIIYSSFKGGYGNLIEIKHSEDYTTRYAHLQNFHKRSTLGKRVKQGQVIGYVGKSGMATGYHLHYEFHVNGKHTNPLTVKFPNAKPVPKGEREDYLNIFSTQIKQINNFEKFANQTVGL